MNLLRLCVVLAALVFSRNSYAGSLDVMVKDDKGAPVSNAVVYAKEKTATSERAKSRAIIDQRNKQFIPYLTALQVGVTGNEGRALLKNLPPGQYTVEVWQPSLKGAPAKFAQHVDLAAKSAKELVFSLDLKPDFRAKQAPGLSTGGYR